MLPVQKFVAACLVQSCAVGLMVLAVAPHGAYAAEASACDAGIHSSLDARLAKAADQGPQGLRRFVTRTRMIYEVDYPGAVARVDRYRQARDACNAQVASAK